MNFYDNDLDALIDKRDKLEALNDTKPLIRNEVSLRNPNNTYEIAFKFFDKSDPFQTRDSNNLDEFEKLLSNKLLKEPLGNPHFTNNSLSKLFPKEKVNSLFLILRMFLITSNPLQSIQWKSRPRCLSLVVVGARYRMRWWMKLFEKKEKNYFREGTQKEQKIPIRMIYRISKIEISLRQLGEDLVRSQRAGIEFKAPVLPVLEKVRKKRENWNFQLLR